MLQTSKINHHFRLRIALHGTDFHPDIQSGGLQMERSVQEILKLKNYEYKFPKNYRQNFGSL